MLWGGKLLAGKRPQQLQRFLDHMGDLAKGKTPSKWKGAAKMTPEEKFAKLYSEARRGPATAELEPWGTYPPPKKREYGEFQMNPRYGLPGQKRGRLLTTGQGTTYGPRGTHDPLTERIVAIAHELRHGSDQAKHMRASDPGWLKREFKIPYAARPTEKKARMAESTALEDFNDFMTTIQDPRVYEQLPQQSRRTADAFIKARKASASEIPGGLLGWSTRRGAEKVMNKAWEMLSPRGQAQEELLNLQVTPQAAGRVKGKGMKLGGGGLSDLERRAWGLEKARSKLAAGFGEGTLVTLDGKVHPMKRDQWHTEVASKLKAKRQEFRGFQVRPADVIVPDVEFLKKKSALRKALKSAHDISKNWKPPTISVKLQGLDQDLRTTIVKDAEIPIDQLEEFVKNPNKFLRETRNPWGAF
jgi:hypothetical protein